MRSALSWLLSGFLPPSSRPAISCIMVAYELGRVKKQDLRAAVTLHTEFLSDKHGVSVIDIVFDNGFVGL
jgi:hypothetical protein